MLFLLVVMGDSLTSFERELADLPQGFIFMYLVILLYLYRASKGMVRKQREVLVWAGAEGVNKLLALWRSDYSWAATLRDVVSVRLWLHGSFL
jgi:hypothetical protein